MYVEWYDNETNSMALSKMNIIKALIVHLSGFGKITFNVKKGK